MIPPSANPPGSRAPINTSGSAPYAPAFHLQTAPSRQGGAARDAEVFGDLIQATSDLLAAHTDDQLQVIGDFLDRTRQLTDACADGGPVLGRLPCRPGLRLRRGNGISSF